MRGTVPFLALSAVLCAAAGPTPRLGFAFFAEGWTSPVASGLNSSAARASLLALASTGVRLVALTTTAYVMDEHDINVQRLLPPSPLASSPLAEFDAALAFAASLNLSVIVTPVLDLNWGLPQNLAREAWYATDGTSRAQIGSGFGSNNTAWDALFASYTAWLLPLARVAAANAAPGAACAGGVLGTTAGTVAFSLGDTLNTMFAQDAARWRALATAVRSEFNSGCLTAFADGKDISSISWWGAVDLIGHAGFWPLGSKVYNIGDAPTVDALVAGWTSALSLLSSVSAAQGGKRILVTAGAQSRPNCHINPWGTGSPGADDGNYQGDPSAWPLSYDVACQAAWYGATIESFSSAPWLSALLLHRWDADSTAGGTSNNGWTPHGKPAEALVRNATGVAALTDECGGVFTLPSHCDGSASIVDALSARTASVAAAVTASASSGAAAAAAGKHAFAGASAAPYGGFRGFVFGGPDEWSSPAYRLDSPGALTSLRNMASLGANTVELTPMWFFANVTLPSIYPITALNSPLRTSTDDELAAIISAAKGLHMRVVLSPMVDPDFTLEAQFGCHNVRPPARQRSCSSGVRNSGAGINTNSSASSSNSGVGGPERPGCFWRGQVGAFWPDSPDDCSSSQDWMAWHAAYASFILHYAALAQAHGVDALIVSHELDRPVTNCAAQWASLVSSVRGVYQGKAYSSDELAVCRLCMCRHCLCVSVCVCRQCVSSVFAAYSGCRPCGVCFTIFCVS